MDIRGIVKKTVSSRQIKNSGWMIGAQAFQMICTLVVGMISARYLGPSNFGTLSYTESFIYFALEFVTLEMDGVIIKKMVDHPELEGEYLGGCMALRLLSAAISTVVVTALIFALNPDEPIKITLILIQSVQFYFQAICLFEAWFQRHLQAKYTSAAKIVASLLVAAYKVMLFVIGKDVKWFAFSNSLLYILLAIFFAVFYVKKNGQRIKVKISRGLEVAKESFHIVLAGFMTATFNQVDKIMIERWMTDADVGLYSAAMAISCAWLLVPTAFIQSFQPTIMEIKKSGDERLYLKRLKQVYAAVIWLSLGVALIVSLFSDLIIKILYGAAYQGASKALVITIWMGAFSIIGTARWIWVLCENKTNFVKYFMAFGAISNVIMNYFMIPAWGIVGASIATLITQICCNVIAPLFFKETRVHTKYVLEAFLLRF